MKNEKRVFTFNEHLDKRYGKKGTAERTKFEVKAKVFLLSSIAKKGKNN